MAFSKGTESQDFQRKLFIGMAPVEILAVNPTKEELEKIYGRTIDKEPAYLGEVELSSGKKIPSIRINFVVKSVKDKCGVEVISNMSYFLRDEYYVNSERTKAQIIDRYGRTAWATQDEIKAGAIPQYSKGSANISEGYNLVRRGEDTLTNFLRTYLGIQNVMEWKDGEWFMKPNPENYEGKLDKVADYFKGDVSEIKKIVSFQPRNKVDVCFGVRRDEQGKLYQTVFTGAVAYYGATRFDKILAEINRRKASGGLQNEEYSVEPIKEYVVTPTNFNQDDDDLPMSEPTPANNPWFK